MIDIEAWKVRLYQHADSIDSPVTRERVRGVLDAALDPAIGFGHCPASTRYHGNWEGGLLQHTVLVTSWARAIDSVLRTGASPGKSGPVISSFFGSLSVDDIDFSTDDVVVVSLLHDVGKVHQYRAGVRSAWIQNREAPKVQWVNECGLLSFIGETYPGLFTQDMHVIQSFFTAHTLGYTFTRKQFVALMYHHGGWSDRGNRGTRENPLSYLVHAADIIASQVCGT